MTFRDSIEEGCGKHIVVHGPVVDELLPEHWVQGVELILGAEGIGESMNPSNGTIRKVIVQVNQYVDFVLRGEV